MSIITLPEHLQDHQKLHVGRSISVSLVNKNGLIANPIPDSAANTALASYHRIFLDTVDNESEPGLSDIVNDRIIAPSWANFVKVTGHTSFPSQTNGNGRCSLHLWRAVNSAELSPYGVNNYLGYPLLANGEDKPTPEMHYHNRVAYQTSTNSANYTSLLCSTPWIPISGKNEAWTIYAYQSSGGPVDLQYVYVDSWITADFAE